MPNKRDLNLERFGISQCRYRELKYFSLQYPEWQDVIKHGTHSVKSPQITGMPNGDSISNSTMNLAIKRSEAGNNMQLIEQTMFEAIATTVDGRCNPIYDGDWEIDLYPFMMEAVTNTDITYTYLYHKGIPISLNSFNCIRRYFYFLLDKNKN